MRKRTDEQLYTGITSLSSAKPPTKEEVERLEEKTAARIKLKPAAEVVLALLDTEKTAIYDMRTFFVDRKTTDEEVKIERLVREKYLKTLVRLETKVKQILAVKPPKVTPNE